MDLYPLKVICYGQPTTVAVHDSWKAVGAIATTARWQTGYGEMPFGRFEIRDEDGVLLDPKTPIGSWLEGKTLYVNLRPGVGG